MKRKIISFGCNVNRGKGILKSSRRFEQRAYRDE
jgi:hypothetical protein